MISILYNAGALNAKYFIFTEMESLIISLLCDVEFNLNCVFQLHLYRNEVAKYLQMHGLLKTTKMLKQSSVLFGNKKTNNRKTLLKIPIKADVHSSILLYFTIAFRNHENMA